MKGLAVFVLSLLLLGALEIARAPELVQVGPQTGPSHRHDPGVHIAKAARGLRTQPARLMIAEPPELH